MMKVDIVAVKKFTLEIEKLMVSEELNHIEAIVKYCKNKDIDIKDIVNLVEANPKIKSAIYDYACDYNLVAKTARLTLTKEY